MKFLTKFLPLFHFSGRRLFPAIDCKRKRFDKHCVRYLRRQGWLVVEPLALRHYICAFRGQRLRVVFFFDEVSMTPRHILDWIEIQASSNLRTFVFCQAAPQKWALDMAAERGLGLHNYLDIDILNLSVDDPMRFMKQSNQARSPNLMDSSIQILNSDRTKY